MTTGFYLVARLCSRAASRGQEGGGEPLHRSNPLRLIRLKPHTFPKGQGREKHESIFAQRTPATGPGGADAAHRRMAARLWLPPWWRSEGGRRCRARPCHGHAPARAGRPSPLPSVGAGPLLLEAGHARLSAYTYIYIYITNTFGYVRSGKE